MQSRDSWDAVLARWRGPLLAGLIALLAGLPGLIALPPLDRDESRFAEASAQMLETGDFVRPYFQDVPRFKKPAGIYWLQALAVWASGTLEDRHIWAYRLPSLAGAVLAAAACAWGAAGFLRPGFSVLAGGLLGASFLLSTEAHIAATDGVLAGATTLCLAALGRLYMARKGGPAAGWGAKAAMWLGLALSVLVKGPIGPMVFALTLLALCAVDWKAGWVRDLGWGWGALFLLATLGPWTMAVTVATDGSFWTQAVGGDLAPKLAGGAEGHGQPAGFYLLLLPLLVFPATLALPGAFVAARQAFKAPGVRFALCWLIPSWIVFEATPTKLIHYPLPLFGALAWLMAAGLERGPGPRTRRVGAVLMGIAAILFAAAAPAALFKLQDGSRLWAGLAAALYLAAGLGGAALLWRGWTRAAPWTAIGLGLAAHGVLVGLLAPTLQPLWLSSRAARALTAAGANPRDGLTPGPVAVVGYEEPSLVFLLGADTQFTDAEHGADAIDDGRPAIVEERARSAFMAAVADQGLTVREAGRGEGLDYSNNKRDLLRIFLNAKGVAQAETGTRP